MGCSDPGGHYLWGHQGRPMTGMNEAKYGRTWSPVRKLVLEWPGNREILAAPKQWGQKDDQATLD